MRETRLRIVLWLVHAALVAAILAFALR